MSLSSVRAAQKSFPLSQFILFCSGQRWLEETRLLLLLYDERYCHEPTYEPLGISNLIVWQERVSG